MLSFAWGGGRPAPLFAATRQDGMRLNLNQLGEAILGEGEAQRRMQEATSISWLAMTWSTSRSRSRRSSASSTSSPSMPPGYVKERLRALYRQAMAHHYVHPDGRVTPIRESGHGSIRICI